MSGRLLSKISTMSNHRPFQVVSTVSKLREIRKDAQQVGLVPTMGALHEGHLALIRQAAQENTEVYVSIYVNPTQFGVNEDLSSYPRTWPADEMKLNDLHAEFAQDSTVSGQISLVFMPSTREMYPGLPPTSAVNGEGSFVTITPLGSRLEGASRPVFFRGVATVCMKLFNIVQPSNVYFGQKDIQQTFIIRRMVNDFHIKTNVKICPTIREADGLAMSSRNVYLGERRRKVALALLESLKAVEKAYSEGAARHYELQHVALDRLTALQAEEKSKKPAKRALFEVDYISIADPHTLEEAEIVDVSQGCIVSGAIKILPLEDKQAGESLGLGGDAGPVRLIDNLILPALRPKED